MGVERQRRRSPLILALALALGGCAVGPDFHAPAPALPAAFPQNAVRGADGKPLPASVPAGAAGTDPANWWHALQDPLLDELVARALQGNPSLEAALDRLQAARTFETAVAGTALPRLDASSGGGRGTGTDLTRSRVDGPLQSADRTPTGAARITQISGVDAFWELDVFGRIRREIEAARYDAQAAAAARDGVQIAVIADVARSYLDLRGLQTQLAVLQQDLDAAQSLMRFVQARYDQGITNELDVTLARRQLAAVQAQIAPLDAQRAAARYALAALLGGYEQELPAALEQPATVPSLPERIAPGDPPELLRRRPDIRAAEWDLAGATARAGIATANLFPRIALTGGAGVEGQALGYRPSASQSIWSLGFSAALPLLDFGVLDAVANIADLQARAQLHEYKQTVLRAVLDVDSSLAAYAAQQDRLRYLGDAVLAARRAMVLASERYERGLSDFLNVADAQRQEYDLEGQYAQAQTLLAEQFVAVYRALGGGWEGYAGPPPPPSSQPAVLAMFRRLFSHPGPTLAESPAPPAGPAP
jgi:NodT family efflux transporter outer membrane factor (OMF) lipoprotein